MINTELIVRAKEEGFRAGIEAAAKLLEEKYPLLKHRANEIRKLTAPTPQKDSVPPDNTKKEFEEWREDYFSKQVSFVLWSRILEDAYMAGRSKSNEEPKSRLNCTANHVHKSDCYEPPLKTK